MSKFDVLNGCKILKVLVRPGEEAIAFATDRGTFAFETYGDCCSETWFADVTGFPLLIGQRVWRVEEYDLPEDPSKGERSRQEEDSVMGVKLTTGRGVCTIEYRNSSNGYYGGHVDYVFVPESVEGWKDLTDDWHA